MTFISFLLQMSRRIYRHISNGLNVAIRFEIQLWGAYVWSIATRHMSSYSWSHLYIRTLS